ncbi:MAG: CinA family protein [Clostridia bacterium]|nr:CinA family protein [Clostridia bacterium]
MKPSLSLLIFTSRNARGLEEGGALLEGLSRRGYAPDAVSRIAYDDGGLLGHCLEDALDYYDVTLISCPEEMLSGVRSFISSKNFQEISEFGFKTASKRVYIKCRGAEGPGLDELLDRMDQDLERHDTVSYLRCVGVPDDILSQAIAEARASCPEQRLMISGRHADLRIEIVTPSSLPSSAREDTFRLLLQKLSDYVYAMEDVELNARVVQLLKLRKMHISVAESFTGGGICKKLVEIPGVSEVFDEGLNTYSNRAKMARLGVDRATLNSYGAVSRETAEEMCLGLLNTHACDVAVSTTGIAGPSSDDTNKPVGLMYIGCGTQDRLDVIEYRLKGSREDITATAINLALFQIYKAIKK